MRVSAAIDTAITALAPVWGLRRRQARAAMKAYEATETSRTRRRVVRDNRSGDAVVRSAGTSLRAQARHLERNHDLARGAIGVLVHNICGPHGVGIEPQPRTLGGEIHEDLASAMLELYRDWSRRPEVTWSCDWAATQRLMCRSWIRDGEVLSQILAGRVPLLDHGTRVPLSLEMLEADFLPLDLEDERAGIRQGIEVNAWRRPRAYHLYKTHPGDSAATARGARFKRVPAERMLHIKLTDRIHQLRGVSSFASIITRLDGIKDYEESEQVAAKVAASMAAMIVKGTPDFYDPDKTADPRELKFRAGMIFDDLMPGERVEVIDSKRPNPNVESYRNGQLRAAAAGLGVSYSSMARHYDGTYSAQRQELVEQWVHYAVVTQAFTAQLVRPVWELFVDTAVMAGMLDLPADIDPATVNDALYIGQAMPWIDPKKEAEALEKQEQAGYMSGPEIIRRRGANPREVLEQEAAWRRRLRDRGVVVTADPANDLPSAAPATDTQTENP